MRFFGVKDVLEVLRFLKWEFKSECMAKRTKYKMLLEATGKNFFKFMSMRAHFPLCRFFL